MALPTVCILAGGLGTRLGARVDDTPKPLLEIAGEPFLVHQLRLLAAHGVSEVVLCIRYRGGAAAARGAGFATAAPRHNSTARLGRSGAPSTCSASASSCFTGTPT